MEREVREEEDEEDDWVEKLVDQEILLEDCIYGNYPISFFLGVDACKFNFPCLH